MTDDYKLLREVSKNAATAVDAMNSLLPILEEGEIKSSIQKHKNDASQLQKQASRALNQNGFPRQKKSVISQLNKWNIKMQASLNRRPTHIASMMIQGMDMGIISLQKIRNHTPHAGYQNKALADNLLQFEQNTIEHYKQYL